MQERLGVWGLLGRSVKLRKWYYHNPHSFREKSEWPVTKSQGFPSSPDEARRSKGLLLVWVKMMGGWRCTALFSRRSRGPRRPKLNRIMQTSQTTFRGPTDKDGGIVISKGH